jgi:thioredoxin-related protein
MDKDILIVIVFLFLLSMFYVYLSSSKSETFAQEDNFESDAAFDSSINSHTGDENHGIAFDDEKGENNAPVPAKKAQVIVFLSKHCPHCVHYDNDKFKRFKGRLTKLGKGNVSVVKIYADKDPKALFNKHEVQYVPAAVVVHNGKTSKISGEISPSNALKTINNLSK